MTFIVARSTDIPESTVFRSAPCSPLRSHSFARQPHSLTTSRTPLIPTVVSAELLVTMATRALEARFAGMAINDENDAQNNGPYHLKSKVSNAVLPGGS